MGPKIVEFNTKDKLLLPGLLYEVKGSKKAVVYLHGNGSSSVFYDENEKRILPDEINKKGISFLKFNNRGAHIIKKLKVKKGNEVERLKFGYAYEIISECVLDIDAAVKFLHSLGYKEFYLIGASTGANKTGIYYSELGDKKFWKLLDESKEKIKKGKGEEIIKAILPNEFFSYKGFYDI